jgi:hypothetical protein
MMVLEVCNASVSYDIEGAQEKLDTLKLDDFQGENISAFGVEVQKQGYSNWVCFADSYRFKVYEQAYQHKL